VPLEPRGGPTRDRKNRRAGKAASPGITRCEIEEPVLSPRRKAPDFAELVLGLAEGKTRGLNPGYALAQVTALNPGYTLRAPSIHHRVGFVPSSPGL
jgi:hypothetical protein